MLSKQKTNRLAEPLGYSAIIAMRVTFKLLM